VQETIDDALKIQACLNGAIVRGDVALQLEAAEIYER